MASNDISSRNFSSNRSRSRSPLYKNSPDRGRGRRPGRGRSSSPRPTGSHKIFVTNIPFECKWTEIKDLFRKKVGNVSFVELYEDEFGKSKGCGVVEFKDAATMQKAIEIMDNFEIRGRPLRIKEEFDERGGPFPRGGPPRQSDREFFRERGGGAGSGGFGRSSSPPYNTYGLNPDFIKSLGITGPLTSKIFISNLDFKVTEKKLEEIFKIAGKLTKVDLKVDKEGKNKGHATAEYEHPLEAVQAISMFNGQRLFARIMNVRMDRFADDNEALPSKLPSGLYGIGKGLGAGGLPMQFNKNSTGIATNGSAGIALGNMGAGGMPGSMGVGSSNVGMMPNSGMGLACGSMGMNSAMASDRTMMNAQSMGMGMSGSNMGMSSSPVGMAMGGNSGMMASGMGPSSIDSVGREGNFRLGGAPAPSGRGGYRDGFDRSNDSFSGSYVSDTVLLSNLPSTINWQSLKDRFRDVGDVRFAETKGPGNALIRFSSTQDAQRAVDLMNGVRIDGRVLQVRLY